MNRTGMDPEIKERMSSAASRVWESLSPRLREEMGRVLRRYNLTPPRGMGSYGSFNPSIEVMEDEKSIHVDAELPGVDEKDIDIALTPDTLTISGDKKEEFERGTEDVCCTERSFGPFSRTVSLPGSVDVNKAEAFYRNGVLCINLPKLEGEMAAKKIPIRH